MKPHPALALLLVPAAAWAFVTIQPPAQPIARAELTAHANGRAEVRAASTPSMAPPLRSAVMPVGSDAGEPVSVRTARARTDLADWDELEVGEQSFLAHASRHGHLPYRPDQLPSLAFYRTQVDQLADRWARFAEEKSAARDVLDEEAERIKRRKLERGEARAFDADHESSPSFFGRTADGLVRLPVVRATQHEGTFRGWVEFRVHEEPSFAAALDYVASFDQYELSILQTTPRAIASN